MFNKEVKKKINSKSKRLLRTSMLLSTTLLLFLTITTTSSTTTTANKKKYNILFIGTDQQRTSTLNCYNDIADNFQAFSPNLDRLASEGVRFTDAYTVSPVCSPSRTATLLGVHVPIHGKAIIKSSSSWSSSSSYRYIYLV